MDGYYCERCEMYTNGISQVNGIVCMNCSTYIIHCDIPEVG